MSRKPIIAGNWLYSGLKEANSFLNQDALADKHSPTCYYYA